MVIAQGARLARRGYTVLEVLVAAFIIAVVSFSGALYYASGRISEITEMQRVNAMYLAEHEIDRWQAVGYGAFTGYTTPASLPYGYNFTSNTQTFPRDIVVDSVTYRITCSLDYNTSVGGTDFFFQETLAGLTWRYRRLFVTVRWGASFERQVQFETRMAE